MATYYIDSEHRLHTEQNTDNEYAAWDDADGYFDGKCRAYIEGFRVVPAGETWVRADGVAFAGLMIAPAVDDRILNAAQATYEEQSHENTILKAQLQAVTDRGEFIEDCIAEMAVVVYGS